MSHKSQPDEILPGKHDGEEAFGGTQASAGQETTRRDEEWRPFQPLDGGAFPISPLTVKRGERRCRKLDLKRSPCAVAAAQ